MPTNRTPREIGLIQRYIFIGAGLGLYYGLFYKPTGANPDYGIALVLSALAALVTVLFRFWNKRPTPVAVLKVYFETLIFFSVFLLTLAVRSFLFELGGGFLLAIFTTGVGCVMGYFLAIRKLSM